MPTLKELLEAEKVNFEYLGADTFAFTQFDSVDSRSHVVIISRKDLLEFARQAEQEF
jgi:hypothetical protein